MRILFLDDNNYRVSAFLEWAEEHDVCVAKDAAAAIRWLATPGLVFDQVYLDHDLKQEHYEATVTGCFTSKAASEGSGQEVAAYIHDMDREAQPRLVVVHSYNPVGAEAMMKVLEDGGLRAVRQPFGPGLREIIVNGGD